MYVHTIVAYTRIAAPRRNGSFTQIPRRLHIYIYTYVTRLKVSRIILLYNNATTVGRNPSRFTFFHSKYVRRTRLPHSLLHPIVFIAAPPPSIVIHDHRSRYNVSAPPS